MGNNLTVVDLNDGQVPAKQEVNVGNIWEKERLAAGSGGFWLIYL